MTDRNFIENLLAILLRKIRYIFGERLQNKVALQGLFLLLVFLVKLGKLDNATKYRIKNTRINKNPNTKNPNYEISKNR
jgi:hypothetical protein